ncbi:tripartite motif-containing protein 2-like [Branchiostoma floridae]|uniref:RING-type E3 ubiquitin transferase n=1 Tax=Branchiostoma floridae TaxID=7739 RepID=A0A9J7LD99_BRAFL|nr:tripartite motif-containing protein 2-like [Branchiostoma floridae]
MASNIPVVKQIDKQFLICGICLERYKTPKVLPCLHTFCECCLQTYIPQESLSLSCPVCRQTSILPQKGVSALQNNFFITGLMEVLERPEEDSEDPPEAMKPQPLSCPSHEGQDLEYYCQSCETAVCQNCTAVEHNEHTTVQLKDVVQDHKAALQQRLEIAKSQLPSIGEAIKNIAEISQHLATKKSDAEIEITSAFEELEKAISQRKTALFSELETVYSAKNQVLHDQKEALNSALANISSSCEFTEQALSHGNETEVLLIKKQMSDRLTELASIKYPLKPEQNDFVLFQAELDNIKRSIANMGCILTNHSVGHETVASGEGLRQGVIGRQMSVTITTKDRLGSLIKTGHADISVEIASPEGSVIDGEVADNKNGTYELTYLPQKEGKYSMALRLFGEHVRGSPFDLKVIPESQLPDQSVKTKIIKTGTVRQKAYKRPASSRSKGSRPRSNPIEDDLVMRVGVKGRNKGEFTNPQGVATCPGKIIVADSNNQVIQVFSNMGDFKLKFGARGRNAGQLQRPTGVTVSHNGNYIVADYDNKWVSVFGPDGKFINKFGSGKLLGPKGVAVDKNGHIIVVDNKASCVFIFQSNGKFLQKFGSRGNDDKQFAGPHFVAVSPANNIVVSDFHNHCVKVFDPNGTFLYRFGSNGEGNGQFNAPTGVAVDSSGNIIVADWGNSRIQVFDCTGSFLSYVNTMADPLYGPQGLCLTADGYVAVADSGNHCFKIYKYLQ